MTHFQDDSRTWLVSWCWCWLKFGLVFWWDNLVVIHKGLFTGCLNFLMQSSWVHRRSVLSAQKRCKIPLDLTSQVPEGHFCCVHWLGKSPKASSDLRGWKNRLSLLGVEQQRLCRHLLSITSSKIVIVRFLTTSSTPLNFLRNLF